MEEVWSKGSLFTAYLRSALLHGADVSGEAECGGEEKSETEGQWC